ncbi:MAG: hypothetical protein CBC24_09160 [Candidatus Pelagibacter sp. TMED64]|nr:MAG: hypothetical protein CBC24_09160 [Candidatus Pelagibacter sp. TMED64]|tara:strand:- start:192 stop:593 length:402 start_codon:yes stop_codon:yes gene_type:complete
MKWIVCFAPHSNRGIWRLFTFWRPKYQHVFAVRYDLSVLSWIYVECSSKRMNFDLYKDDKATHLIDYLINECECIEIEVKDSLVYFPTILYCVSFVKHLLGIRNMFLLTPYQLRCELIKQGGSAIFTKNTGEI